MIEIENVRAELLAAERLVDARAFRPAREQLNRIADALPDNPWVALLRSRIARDEGDAGLSRTLIRQAIHTGEPDPDVFGRAAQILIDAGDSFVDAVIRTGLAEFPDHASLIGFAVTRPRVKPLAAQPAAIGVIGNCQSDALARLASYVPVLADRFAFVGIPTHAAPNEPLPALSPEVQRAELLWEQVHHGADVGALRDDLNSRLPSACRILRVPPIGLMSCWPFAFSNRFAKPEPGFPWGRYPLGDRIANEMIVEQIPREEAVPQYLARTRAKMPELSRLVARDRRLLSQHENGCEVTISDYIFEHFRTEKLFLAWGQASNTMLAELLVRLVAASGIDVDLATVASQARIVAGILQEQAHELPVHPDVIDRLEIEYVDKNSTYSWFGNYWTFEEYMTRYITQDTNWKTLG